MNSQIFDPKKSFLHLPIVWIITSAFLIFSAIIFSIIVINTELTIDFSSSGFNSFISIFRFPLGVLTLIIPIIALLAANHRSEQTKAQILVTSDQNNFSNYYKHLEEFKKYFDPSDIDYRYVHKMVFPNSLKGNYSICEKLLFELNKMQEIPQIMLENLPSDFDKIMNQKDIDLYLKHLSILEEYIKHDLKVTLASISSEFSRNCNNTPYFFTCIGLLNKANKTYTRLNVICNFSVDYNEDLKLKKYATFCKVPFYIQSNRSKEELTKEKDMLLTSFKEELKRLHS